METGEKIRSIADSKGIKLTSIANHLDISRQSLNVMLKAKSIKFSNVEKIASFLNEPLSSFYENESEEMNSRLHDALNSKIKLTDLKPPKWELKHDPEQEKRLSQKDIDTEKVAGQTLMLMSVQASFFEFFRNIQSNIVRWEQDKSITKKEMLKQIKDFIGVANYHINSASEQL